MTIERCEIVSLLSRIATPTATHHSVPLRSVLVDVGCSREELLHVIGDSLEAGRWEVKYEPARDSVKFRRLPAAGAPIRDVMATCDPVSNAPTFDPVAVATKARAFQDSERKAGRTISATAAVEHILNAEPPKTTTTRTPGAVSPKKTGFDWAAWDRWTAEQNAEWFRTHPQR